MVGQQQQQQKIKQTYGDNVTQKAGIYAVLLHRHPSFIALHLLDMHVVVLSGIGYSSSSSSSGFHCSSNSSSSSRTAEDHVMHSVCVACCKLLLLPLCVSIVYPTTDAV
jgi:hypothetical protein